MFYFFRIIMINLFWTKIALLLSLLFFQRLIDSSKLNVLQSFLVSTAKSWFLAIHLFHFIFILMTQGSLQFRLTLYYKKEIMLFSTISGSVKVYLSDLKPLVYDTGILMISYITYSRFLNSQIIAINCNATSNWRIILLVIVSFFLRN